MNQEEYEVLKNELEQNKITREIVEKAPESQQITDEDIDKMIAISETIITDEEKERILNKEDEIKFLFFLRCLNDYIMCYR